MIILGISSIILLLLATFYMPGIFCSLNILVQTQLSHYLYHPTLNGLGCNNFTQNPINRVIYNLCWPENTTLFLFQILVITHWSRINDSYEFCYCMTFSPEQYLICLYFVVVSYCWFQGFVSFFFDVFDVFSQYY